MSDINTEAAEAVVIPDADLSDTVSRMMAFEPGPENRTIEPKPQTPPGEVKPDPKPADQPKPDGKPDEKKEKPEGDLTPAEEAEYRGKKAGDWKVLKGERDRFRAEVETARKELEHSKAELQKARASGAPKEELDLLRKERDELSERLQRVGLEQHPKFQSYFNQGMDKLVGAARQIVGGELGPRIERILKMGDEETRAAQLEEVYGSLTSSQQARLGAVLTRMDELRSEREQALTDWKSNYGKIQESERAAQQTRLQEATQLFESVLGEAQQKIEVFKPREGDDAWNAEIKQRMDTARQIFTGENDPQELARAAVWAAAAPVYRAMLGKQQSEIAKLQAQIKELTAAQPMLNGAASDPLKAHATSFVDRVLNGD